MPKFEVVDLSVVDLTAAETTIEAKGEVDLDSLRSQLEQIRDAIIPLLQAQQPAGIGLSSIEIALSVGFEGKVWFIAKGTAEASIKLTFARPESSV
jgi:hypothetical protein